MANDDWETPPWVMEHARRLFGAFDLDVCATDSNFKAPAFYTIREDGLSRPWDRKWWMNPPYSNIGPWVEKAAKAEHPGVALLQCDHSTRWWQAWVEGHAIIVPIGKRVKFLPSAETKAERERLGKKDNGPAFHSVFALYGWRVRK